MNTLRAMRIVALLILFGAVFGMCFSMMQSESWLVSAAVALPVTLSLYPAMDLCRVLLVSTYKKVPRGTEGLLLMLIVLIVLPGVPTLTLLLIGKTALAVPAAATFVGAWRVGFTIAIIHGWLRYCDVPGSIRGVRAYLKDVCA